ncbi:MAG: addiction module protein [Pseudanabaena sp.]|nr:MAG: addiction module protein [Pseudanabaena sp.]
MNTSIAQVFELTLSEKLQLLEDLWDSIALNPEQIPVLEWHIEELDERKSAYLQNPTSVTSWDVVKKKIRKRLNDD